MTGVYHKNMANLVTEFKMILANGTVCTSNTSFTLSILPSHQSIHPSIPSHQSIHPSIPSHQSIHPSIYPSIYLLIFMIQSVSVKKYSPLYESGLINIGLFGVITEITFQFVEAYHLKEILQVLSTFNYRKMLYMFALSFKCISLASAPF